MNIKTLKEAKRVIRLSGTRITLWSELLNTYVNVTKADAHVALAGCWDAELGMFLGGLDHDLCVPVSFDPEDKTLHIG